MVTIKYLFLIAIFLILDTIWSKQDDIWTDSRTASQSRIGQLRQFEEIHRAQTKNTQPRVMFDLDADDNLKLEYPILTLQNVSTNIVIMSVEANCHYYYWAFYNAYVLLFVQNKYFYYIKRGNIDNHEPIITWLHFLLYLEDPLSEMERILSGQETNIVFNIWNPFQSGIVGFGTDKNSPSDSLLFNLIYRNQTSHIDTTNQSIIAYIQEDFLQIIANDLPETTRDGFIALMFFSKNKIYDSSNGVGFRIPQYCNRSGIAPLKVYFDSLPRGNWTNFGTFYSPNGNIWYSTCLIEKMSYISFDVSINRYYKSHETVKYCPPTTFEIGPYMVDFDATPRGKFCFPKALYFDNYLNILFAKCELNQSFILDITPYNPMNISYLITNQTMELYRTIMNRYYADYSNVNLQFNSETTYIDVYLHIANAVWFNSQERLIPLLNEGVKRLQSQAEHSNQILYLVVMVEIPLALYMLYDITYNSNNSIAVFERLTQEDKAVVGVALYSDNIIKPITNKYPTDEFMTDENIDVIVQFSNHSDPVWCEIGIVIFTDEFYYKKTHLSKTKIVGVHVTKCRHNCHLDIYLKVLDGNSNGFWYTTNVSKFTNDFIFINELNQNICMSGLMWNIIKSGRFVRSLFRNSFNTETKPIDILSHLSMLFNRKSSRNYYKNYEILTGTKTITSILSIIGITCMFLTCLLFKNWLKQRIYTNQLCISLLIQAIFFLLNKDLLNHIAYVLFYYSILTQFIWMAFVSYVQYVRFIKVFGNPQFNLTKSLIFGWGLPALITTASTIIYKDCLRCEFCSKNDEIFKYFVILPIILIITCNIAVYIAVMINLWRSEIQESYKKYRVRATVAMPFMLGLAWIVLASVMAPDPIISLVGWYLFYIIIPSQGFVLFIFMVLLDKDTRHKWLELLRIKRKIL